MSLQELRTSAQGSPLPDMDTWPLAPLAAIPQWILATIQPGANGKTDKIPRHYVTGEACNAHDPANWTTYEAAQQLAAERGAGWGVGFVITAADDVVCIDLDHVLQPDGAWHPAAVALVQSLPGAVTERSQSGHGLHIWCRYPNPPTHRKKRRDLEIDLECYSAARFILLGTDQVGKLAERCDALPAVLARYFEPVAANDAQGPDDGPRDDWSGPTDDDELIRRALRSQSGGKAFGGKASFADLWNRNVDALSRSYPGNGDGGVDWSSADAALAQHLAWWTGNDQARMVALMQRSALVRDKWEREDYLPRTVASASARQRDVMQERPPAQQAAPPEAGGPVHNAITGEPMSRYVIRSDDVLQSARGVLEREFAHPDADRLKQWHDVFYRWDGAAWRALTEGDMNALLYAALDRHAPVMYRPTRDSVGKLVHALKAVAHVDSATSPPCWIGARAGPPPCELIACRNGLLHLPSAQLLPPTPALFSTNAVPYNFRPDAPPPMAWLQFLASVWPDDPASISTLQEMFGYLLTPDTTQQKAFLLIGPKRAGKGTIGRVLSALLGPESVTSPSISSLGSEFGLQPLVGKLAAVISDARLGSRSDPRAVAENLLRITGQDPVNINRKFLEPVTLHLPVRFVMMTNELPRLADASGAMASRFVILKLPGSFYGREDHGLSDRLLAELPGILNWSITGWKRLQARGHFVQPPSALGDAQALADLGSPISAFLRDVCDVSPTAEVPVDQLYQLWSAWCSDQGIDRRTTKQTFGADLAAALPGLKTLQPRTAGGGRYRAYQGVGVRPGTHWHAIPTIAPRVSN